MNKKLLQLLLAMMISLLIVGCGSNNEGNNAEGKEGSSSNEASDDSVHYLSTNNASGGEVPVYVSLTEEKTDYELDIETVPQTDLVKKIQLLSASDDLPEVFDYESGKPLQELIDADAVLNVEDAFKELGIYEQLNPGAVDLLKRLAGGKGLYAVPTELNLEGFWFNKQIFEENGLEVPTTWDEMLNVSETLKQNGVQPFAVAGKEKWPITRLINAYVMRYYGVEAMEKVSRGELDITEEGFVKAAEQVKSMADKGYFGKGANTLDADAAVDMFLQGQAAMYYMGTWAIADFSNEDRNQIGIDNIGFFNVPTVEGGVGTLDEYNMNAGLIVAFSKDKYNDKMKEWTKAVFSDYGDRAMKDLGLISGFDVAEMPEDVNPLTKLISEEIANVKDGALWFEANFDARTKQVSEDNAQLLISDGISPEEYMEELAKEIE
ncbi:ABC transporter substrate-binding protein [Aquibacillus albus]|uniref:Raffinose/stachyose/melibiose transport system substrate-binding protein n=1 Tax=Aquibacillus albus TaxID=1168171 RepID=A0ABS2N4F9_9BACI|nr:extracellular solute-binding protein [Aquibacillus albus]MBM7572988.1 raffinose/stachyose/melibiose transport system substrate-binding protein [Aquibacillus albus]